MEIGIIGLGKMVYNLALNLKRNKHKVVAYDIAKENVDRIVTEGISPAYIIEEMVSKLEVTRKVILIMVPSGPTVDHVILELKASLNPHEIIIDGVNSNFNDSVERYMNVKSECIQFLV